MSQPVFNVVAKDCQPPHVYDYVHPRGMYKHGSNEGKQGDISRKITSEPLVHMLGKKGILGDEGSLASRSERPLKGINCKVDDDEQIIDVRSSRTRSVITDGEHFRRASFDYDAR